MRVFFHNEADEIVGHIEDTTIIPNINDHVEVSHYNRDKKDYAIVNERFFNYSLNEVIIKIYCHEMRIYQSDMKVKV